MESYYSTEKKSGFKKHAPKVIGAFLTAVVLLVLVFAGPAQALLLGLNVEKQYKSNADIVFDAIVQIRDKELANLQTVDLLLNGENVCTFDVFGNPLEGCEGIEVELVENSLSHGYGYGFDTFKQSTNPGLYTGTRDSFGFGYGFFGTGKLKYRVTVSPTHDALHSPGNNVVDLVLHSDTQSFTTRARSFLLL